MHQSNFTSAFCGEIHFRPTGKTCVGCTVDIGMFVMDTKSVVRTIMETEDAEAQARGPKMKENGRTPL